MSARLGLAVGGLAFAASIAFAVADLWLLAVGLQMVPAYVAGRWDRRRDRDALIADGGDPARRGWPMIGFACRLGPVRAVLLVAAGATLIGVALTASPAPQRDRPIWLVRPSTDEEDRRWQLGRLSDLIDEARRADGVAVYP